MNSTRDDVNKIYTKYVYNIYFCCVEKYIQIDYLALSTCLWKLFHH